MAAATSTSSEVGAEDLVVPIVPVLLPSFPCSVAKWLSGGSTASVLAIVHFCSVAFERFVFPSLMQCLETSIV